MLKNKIIKKIIEVEGGYVDDPSDSGGKTKYGITEKVAKANGWIFDMQKLPYDLAFKIYSQRYWDSMNLDEIEKLSAKVAEELCDTGVNIGTTRASIFLQRCLNVLNNKGLAYHDIIVDGDIGGKTLRALRAFFDIRKSEGEQVLLAMLNCLQGEFYISLAEKREKDERFVFGWFKHRVC